MHGGGKSPYVHVEAASFSLILTLCHTDMSWKKRRTFLLRRLSCNSGVVHRRSNADYEISVDGLPMEWRRDLTKLIAGFVERTEGL